MTGQPPRVRVAVCVHVCVFAGGSGCDVAESSYQVHAWRGKQPQLFAEASQVHLITLMDLRSSSSESNGLVSGV